MKISQKKLMRIIEQETARAVSHFSRGPETERIMMPRSEQDAIQSIKDGIAEFYKTIPAKIGGKINPEVLKRFPKYAGELDSVSGIPVEESDPEYPERKARAYNKVVFGLRYFMEHNKENPDDPIRVDIPATVIAKLDLGLSEPDTLKCQLAGTFKATANA
jgi:hypothetical protein